MLVAEAGGFDEAKRRTAKPQSVAATGVLLNICSDLNSIYVLSSTYFTPVFQITNI